MPRTEYPPTAGGVPSCTVSSCQTRDGLLFSSLSAEFSIGIALALGLFTRLAALGSLALLFTYVMSGTASVCAFYAFFAIVILATWRTSSWIGVDGLISGYRQRHQAQVTQAPVLPSVAVTTDKTRVPLTSVIATSKDGVNSKDEPVAVG